MVKIETEPKIDFHQVLIRPQRSTINSRSEVSLSRTINFKYSTKTWSGTPIIAANMDTIGTFGVYEVLSKHKLITAMNKFYNVDDYKEYISNNVLNPDLFMVSTGIGEGSLENVKAIFDEIPCSWLCIDIANGYISNFVNFCSEARKLFPDKIICAGNVVSGAMVQELVLKGKVDVVKVGIGPGSAYKTRLKTGVGMPQLSAIIECADYAHGLDAHIIGDGGITCPGDASKAFGGGADFIMMGGTFAGHDENPGEIIEKAIWSSYEQHNKLKKFKKFYGMSSKLAMEKHYGKMEQYRSSEGREIIIPYKGKLEDTVLDYLGGIRSTCSYINAQSIKQMSKRTTFVMVGQQLNTSLI